MIPDAPSHQMSTWLPSLNSESTSKILDVIPNVIICKWNHFEEMNQKFQEWLTRTRQTVHMHQPIGWLDGGDAVRSHIDEWGGQWSLKKPPMLT